MSILPVHPVTGAVALGWRKARPGEDDATLYPIWPICGGDGRDDSGQGGGDGDDDQDDDGDGDGQGDDGEGDDDAGDGGGDGDDGQDDDTDDEDQDDDTGDAAALGDKGKRALARMKEKLKAERAKRRKVEQQISSRDGGDESNPETIRRQAEQAATAKANTRIVRSEVRAAAKGRLADPRDALTFIDLDQFEVDENGQVDEDEITDAIDDLLKNKPYLAAATAKRFQGTGDGGAQRKAGRPRQLTEKDLDRMTPEQIVKAQDEGRLDDLLGAG